MFHSVNPVTWNELMKTLLTKEEIMRPARESLALDDVVQHWTRDCGLYLRQR